jgi:NAD(P)H-hydrate epimerase
MLAFERSGGAVSEIPDASVWQARRDRVLRADLVVDALLGTGLERKPTGLVGTVIEDLAEASRLGVPVVAVDLPSGVSSDTGELAWPAPRAALTVTFGAPKHGHVLPPACDLVGRLEVVDIGIPRSALADTGSKLGLLEPADAARAFTRRPPGSHKGSYGHLLVVAGSVGKSGAAILAARAALRSGVGLVTVATPAPALPLVAAGAPEIMTEPLAVGEDGGLGSEAIAQALALLSQRDAAVIGPGLGQRQSTQAFVQELLDQCSKPVLVDADGLNALAAIRGRSAKGPERLSRRHDATVLTPHPGEMARLMGTTAGEVQRDRLPAVRALAGAVGCTVALKGQRTLVAEPDGRTAVNPTGNPGMATGGTGDILAGIIGALLAARQTAWTAATAGVYLHGLAGDRASARRGSVSCLPSDLLDELPEAIRSVTGHLE